MTRLPRSALLFIAIGLAIYAGVYYAAEWLVYRTGKSNPFFKIASTERVEFDWLILGASHAMPLDFADFNTRIERETGLRTINLATPGTGPLYNRFVLENFLREHRIRNLLYVVDSFAFYATEWNEGRFMDAKLLRRTPFKLPIAESLYRYIRYEGVDPRAGLDYLTGFSKINNRERFTIDVWDGEKQFERIYRPSAAAVRSRIEYLYPGSAPSAMLPRYFEAFVKLIERSHAQGICVTAIKMPLTAQFRNQLPNEEAFDNAISALLDVSGVEFRDFSRELDESRFYFDTDHLNRAGLERFLDLHLKSLLTAPCRGK
ncbi:MAG TPA: hypothetical protein VH765_02895 [Xanthobacteraceae bacterium]|jgi:hypothetical protein